MAKDKYNAVWVSHTSISDFLECPRAYFLKHVYKDPQTGHKIKLMSPPLALGQAVHEVLDALSELPTQERFREPLLNRLDLVWQKVSGKKGGFISSEAEARCKERGRVMLRRVTNYPGPLKKPAVKIKGDSNLEGLPWYWLSEKDNLILCGKIDWLEYLLETDSVHIIDFKTGKNEEDPSSLQLPAYVLLATRCQERQVTKASYWYLERSNIPQEQLLPDIEEAQTKILEIAKKIKLARQLNHFKCPQNGCWACRRMEKILEGEAELVGVDEQKRDVYIFPDVTDSDEKESTIF